MKNLPDYSTKRFLVADDEVFMLETIERVLKQCNARLVIRASDGGKALRSIKDGYTQVDCIIADFSMKPLNGLQLLQGVRLGINAKIPRDIPFIMLTGHADTEVVKAAIALDVHGYIVKPVAPEKLYQTIDKVFRRPIEIKDADHYRGIKLPAAQSAFGDDIQTYIAPWTILSRAKGTKPPKDVQELLEQFKREHPIQDGTDRATPPNKREQPVTELREGQILAQDIEAQEGAIMLRRGTPLTKDMVERLKAIAARTEPGRSIWVGAPE